ncbi:hypothetical protein LMG19089_03846 [Ralstonia edaphis]|uniref:hypothetical protein n=1 Tax=Ralstonia edaphi TaxID=3058599 RepID=UPI0028F527E0|nr:hypothetical protein [Ralstonia sp. LMG 6871]CAJ0705457.1 hypothetical protein LMG19089_03846 [Ralstonia sp. LMG 6871]
MATAQQQIPAQQVQNATNGNNILQTTVQLVQRYWLRVTVQMQEGTGTRAAANLPYTLTQQDAQNNANWIVLSNSITHISSGEAKFAIPGAGRYRLYVKEPNVTIPAGNTFPIPYHQLPSGQASQREVQPWMELVVTESGAPQTFNVAQVHPNTLGRPANLYPAAANSLGPLNNTHASAAHALNLGEYRIKNQLWSDISTCYGTSHPSITGSVNRAALEQIYGEHLVPDGQTATRELQLTNRIVRFEAMSTQGGRQTQGFADANLMTADECLRKTHPSVLDWWLSAMQALNITYARSTGAWRPHTGSTRHRYSLALDITHLRTVATGSDGNDVTVEIHLHRIEGTDAKPTASDAETNTPTKVLRRDFSRRFHRYLAEQRQTGALGWLGGPWELTYANVGMQGNTTFIKTDSIHIHHVHVSVGREQP